MGLVKSCCILGRGFLLKTDLASDLFLGQLSENCDIL